MTGSNPFERSASPTETAATTASKETIILSSSVSQKENDDASSSAPPNSTNDKTVSTTLPSFVRPTILPEINKQVLRRKLARQRHCIIEQGIQPAYLDTLFLPLLQLFAPQAVQYNGGIAGVKDWKISCYLEVMSGGVPTTDPNLELLQVFHPLLDACNQLFCHWYRQQHACNTNDNRINKILQSLLKHVDGAGKVDGSIVVALPVDRWSPGGDHSFQGGGLTFWDGKQANGQPVETHYDTRSGDLAFIDRAVWHQADPITQGTRWALVIFYKVL